MARLTVPQKAGSTSLLSQLADGNVVILQSWASGKSLRSFHGTAQGVGGFGVHAQWKVHVRRPGVIALQNIHTSEHWLAIRDGKTIGNGKGGPYCDFIALEVGGHVVLESVQYRGRHVGVLPNGNIKEPGRTGTRHHAQFELHIHKSIKFEFVNGSVVVLQSCASGKSLRSYHGTADGVGGRGLHAQWKVHVRRPGIIALQNIHTSEHWLAIRDGKTIGNGAGGPYCEFIVKESIDRVVLESVQYRRQHVGVLPNGTVKEPGRTGTGQHAQFVLITLSTANTSPFVDGSVVILTSRASGKSLRSYRGTAEGVGGTGAHAQWKVHVRRPGVIALQNIHTSEHWLAIHDGKTIGNGRGGPYCELIVKEIDGHVVLESVQYRGQHVGVLPNGNIKEPGRTGTGHHAQFCLLVHKQPQNVSDVAAQMAGLQITSLALGPAPQSTGSMPSCPPAQAPPFSQQPHPFPPSQLPSPYGPAYPPPQNPAYPMGYQAPPPYYPGYQAPPMAGYPGYQAPPTSGYPGYQLPPASCYPGNQLPLLSGYPGFQALPVANYPCQNSPPTSGYHHAPPPKAL